MLSHKIVLLSAIALLALLAACRGESPSTSGSTSVAAETNPAPSSTRPPDQPKTTATGIAATPTEPPSGPIPTESAGTFPVATSSIPDSAILPKPTEAPYSTAELTPIVPAGDVEDDLAAIRQIVKEYWEALNDYDVDRAIAMLEEKYREAEEDLIRKDIGRMKLFRVKLGMSEEIPPTLNDEGDYETYLAAKTPVDTRRVLMVFRQIDGRWWIVFSDEVE